MQISQSKAIQLTQQINKKRFRVGSAMSLNAPPGDRRVPTRSAPHTDSTDSVTSSKNLTQFFQRTAIKVSAFVRVRINCNSKELSLKFRLFFLPILLIYLKVRI